MSGTGLFASITILATAGAAFAQSGVPLPSCALSGAQSVMIGGKPALRMADVINCPPELYTVVPSIFIEGQPVVHFRSGTGAKADCSAKGEPSVMLEGKAAQRTGDVACEAR